MIQLTFQDEEDHSYYLAYHAASNISSTITNGLVKTSSGLLLNDTKIVS